MKIALGSDQSGFDLKAQLAAFLAGRGSEIVDLGPSPGERLEYARIAYAVALHVSRGSCDRGIIVGPDGIGSAVVANKVKGVRAALGRDIATANKSRERYDANVLTLGWRLTRFDAASRIVESWLAFPFDQESNQRRIRTIAEIEAGRLEAAVEAGDLAHAQGPPPPAAPAASVREPAAVAPAELARAIDHTLLKPEAGAADIARLCAEARQFGFAAVCVNPVHVAAAARALAGSGVAVCTVAGFPLGASLPAVKAAEAERAVAEGAREIDMVIDVGALKEGRRDAVREDIRGVVAVCRPAGALVKVIIEAALLSDGEKRLACEIARDAGAAFVKTSTGFGPGGATAEDVALMAEAVKGSGVQVKAAGGIRTLADARRMLAAGAARLGTSAGAAIMAEAAGSGARA